MNGEAEKKNQASWRELLGRLADECESLEREVASLKGQPVSKVAKLSLGSVGRRAVKFDAKHVPEGCFTPLGVTPPASPRMLGAEPSTPVDKSHVVSLGESLASKVVSLGEKLEIKDADLNLSLSPTASDTRAPMKIWAIWEAPLPDGVALGTRRSSERAGPKLRYGDDRREEGCLQRLVVRPSSPSRMCWDLFSILCMFYDVLMIPMQVFPFPSTVVTRVLDFCTVVFWTLDIPFTFLSGFQSQGILEMRPRKIAKSYFKTLFFVDLVIVAVDWFILLNSVEDSFVGSGVLDVGRLFKWTRILRLLGLLRAIRLMKLLNVLLRVADSIAVYFSEGVVIVVNVLNAMLFIMVACHFFACGWYFVGTLDSAVARDSLEGSWVKALEHSIGGDPSLGYRYLTALHWALTQFTPASMEVVPRNAFERIFAICTVLIALVVFSSFISSITGSMARMRMLSIDSHRLIHNVRRFILEHRLTLDTGTRIQNFVRRNHEYLRRRQETDFSILQQLPEKLRQDLRQEIFLPVLGTHPLFWHHCEYFQDESLVNICDQAMMERFVLESERLFTCDQQAKHAYFFSSGDCWYTHGYTAPDMEEEREHEHLEKGTMVAEPVLWVQWHHRGAMVSRGPYWCFALDVEVYHKVLTHAPVFKYIAMYARQFVMQRLRDKGEDELSDLSTSIDVAQELAQGAFEECCSEVMSLRGVGLRRSRQLFHIMTLTKEWVKTRSGDMV